MPRKWEMANHKDWVYYAFEGWARAEVKIIKLVGWAMERKLTEFANITNEDDE